MNSLKTLLKYTLINKLNLNKVFKNVKKDNLVLVIILLLLGSVGAFLFSTFYMFMMGETLQLIGSIDLLILMGLAFGSMMCFITNIPMCEAMIFHSKDYEMLSSMPIKTRDIVISKFLSLIIINYGVMALLTFSAVLVVYIYGALTIPTFLLTLVVYIFSPMIPLATSGVCSFAFTKLTAKLKYKNIITTILSMIFIIAIMAFSMSFSNIEENPNYDTYYYMMDMFKKMSYPAYISYLGIKGDTLSIIIYCLISIAVIFAFFFVVTKNYHKINSDMKVSYRNLNFSIEKQTLKDRKTKKNLDLCYLKLELKKYFNLSGYVLNTIIGPIMGTIMLVLLMIQDLDVTIIQLGGDSYLALVVVALVTIFSNISPTTASTISLEGKNLWILKSMPIEAKLILKCKALVSLITSLPFSIINGILVYLIWDANLLDLVFIIIIPILFTIVMTYLSLYINLLLPRFDWDNPIKIIKNSSSVMVSMLVSFAIYFVSLIMVVLLIVLDAYVYMILGILTLVLLVLSLVSIALVNTKGVVKFNNLVG